MQALVDTQQFDDLLASGIDFIIFKHSGTCSISGGACKEVGIAVQELSLEHIYMLDVLNTGNLKYYVADVTEIKHESPQVLIFQGGKLKYHASHSTISRGWFAQCLVGWHDTRKG